MASRGRSLCILMALVGAVLAAAPTASMADATWTGTRRHHLAPAPAPAARSSATPPPVPRSRAHAGPVSTARSPVPSEGPAPATLAPLSDATPPTTASSTGPLAVPDIAHSSAAAPAVSSAWGAAFLSAAGLVAVVLR
ncbi:hypothetical protein SORBI_3003G364950 [Sorghum bicolor]|uniref:Uncharacterized protein n=1 Tax=Sorghum bicolor TaxID=4558 RepID=A0A1W0W0L7_SORBI|nr:hypothetical protein SORBI_3003G364950 [Sorghum bicolor]